MAAIFLSHSTADQAAALEICEAIEKAGYTTWVYEEDSTPGLEYIEQVSDALDACQVVILIISEASLASNQVHNEIVRAYEDGKRFIPVLKGVTHEDYQRKRPVWRQVLGASTSIAIPEEGVAGVAQRIVDGLRAMHIDVEPRPEPPAVAPPATPPPAEPESPAVPARPPATPPPATPPPAAEPTPEPELAAVAEPMATPGKGSGKLKWLVAVAVALIAVYMVFIRAPAGSGSLYVSTVPVGASVWVDGDSMGRTPIELRGLSAGERMIRIAHPECMPLDTSVLIDPQGLLKLDRLRLAPGISRVTVRSDPPEATVWLDGAKIGETPLTINSAPCGDRNLRVMKPRFVEFEGAVKIIYPATELSFTLRPGAVALDGHWVARATRDSIVRVRYVGPLTRRAESALECLGVEQAAAALERLRRYAPAAADKYADRLAEARERTSRMRGHESAVTCVAVSPDGGTIVSGDAGGAIRVWRVGTGASHRVLLGHDGGVASVAVGADGGSILSAGVDRTFRVWEMSTGKLAQTVRASLEDIAAVDVGCDGRFLTSRGESTVRVWRASDQSAVRSLSRALPNALAVAVSSDGEHIVVGADAGIQLWHADAGNPAWTGDADASSATALCVSRDGALVASVHADNTIHLWDVEDGAHVRTLSGHEARISGAHFSEDGTQIVSGDADGEVRLWTVATGEVLETFCSKGSVAAVAMAPDGYWVAAGGSDTSVRTWSHR